jgi:hypothetical protein
MPIGFGEIGELEALRGGELVKRERSGLEQDLGSDVLRRRGCA